MTIKQAAKELDVTPRYLRAEIARGNLIAEKKGRDWHVKPSDLKRYQDGRKK